MKITLGNWIDRAIASIFGYKSENLQKLENYTSLLQSTETGKELYNTLDQKEEVININIKENLVTKDGTKINGVTSPSMDENSKTESVDIKIDPEACEMDLRNVDLKKEDSPVPTMAHELGHAKKAIEDPIGYKIEIRARTAEQVQAKPYEKAVRKELINSYKKNDDEKKE
jgi:hypothetical protein